MSGRALRVGLLVMILAFLIAVGCGGWLLKRQSEELTSLRNSIDALSQAQRQNQQENAASSKGTKDQLNAAQKQIAGLAGGLTDTQNRLSVDEKQLEVTRKALPPNVAALAKTAIPSVVLVACNDGVGSGFALKLPVPSGFSTVIVTAGHVVKDCASPPTGSSPSIMITQQDHQVNAVLQAIDVAHDVALLDVTAQIPALSPADAAPTTGEFVMAIGNPLGQSSLTNSVTQGNISKVTAEQFTHTAAISNGNSGGPLLNSSGMVVGLVSGAYTATDQAPVVENLNVAARLTTLCDAAMSGSACTSLH